AAFVRDTGYYDRVLDYDDVGSLADEPAVLVDFAGNGALLERVHRHLANQLRHSAQVGVTHWERMAAPTALPGPTPEFFFAPAQRARGEGGGGASGLWRRGGEAPQRFTASTRWLRIVEPRAPAAVEQIYHAMVSGRIDPAEGHIC